MSTSLAMDMHHDRLEQIGPYRIISPMGRGFRSRVYRARNPVLRRDVALKVCDPQQFADSSAETNRRLFLNEAKIAGMLSHPNIVMVHDAGSDGELLYLVMECVYNGRSIQRYCKPEEQMDMAEVVQLIQKCALALHYAHENDVVHRDIKPRNILLGEGGEPRIADFGLALRNSTDATMTYLTGVGSPLYMSPEQAREDDITHQTDIFSLGVILYEMLTGRHPFAAPVLADVIGNILTCEQAPLRKLRADAPKPLQQIVNRALQKDPKRRYQSALDFAADLDLIGERMTKARSNQSRERRFQVARELRFFQGFEDKEIKEIVASAKVQTYAESTEILGEGDRANCFFILVKGEVAVRKGDTELARLTRGSCFGELGALTNRARTATVHSTKRSTVMMIPSALLSEASPGCQLRLKTMFLNTLANRLANTLEMVC
ncbi:MAG: serine/threonine-protein kinase [Pseudomonadota bacterium]